MLLLPAANATGSVQPRTPWAFYEFLQAGDNRYACNSLLPNSGPYAVQSNTAVVWFNPENVIRGPLAIVTFRESGNISAFTDDLLDWDSGIVAAPLRPSGRISVTLRYDGKGVPRPLDEY